MKELFEKGQSYVNGLSVMEFGIIKICLLALGVFTGVNIPKRHRNCVSSSAFTVFLVSYVFLLYKFLPFLLSKNNSE